MTRITIGVQFHAQPERLRATLASIERNATLMHDLVLLPDGYCSFFRINARPGNDHRR
jgi:hypothetical protein